MGDQHLLRDQRLFKQAPWGAPPCRIPPAHGMQRESQSQTASLLREDAKKWKRGMCREKQWGWRLITTVEYALIYKLYMMYIIRFTVPWQAYLEPKRLQLQLRPTRTQEERQLQPDSSDEGQSALCLVGEKITYLTTLKKSEMCYVTHSIHIHKLLNKPTVLICISEI